jgi:hypothetical protein
VEIPEIKGAIDGVPYAQPKKRKPGVRDVEKTERIPFAEIISEDQREGHQPPTEDLHPEARGDKKKKDDHPPGHVDIKV